MTNLCNAILLEAIFQINVRIFHTSDSLFQRRRFCRVEG